MLTAVRRIFGRIMHSQTALRGQWDKGWKNNLLFASPSIRRPTPEIKNRFSLFHVAGIDNDEMQVKPAILFVIPFHDFCKVFRIFNHICFMASGSVFHNCIGSVFQ